MNVHHSLMKRQELWAC